MLLHLILLFLLSLIMTGAFRQYALSKSILDIPNSRSSHVVPTPRGGGVAFVVCFLMWCLYFGYLGSISLWDFVGFFGAGFCIALLGFMDDHIQLTPKLRLLGHFFVGGFALYCLGGMESVALFGWILPIPTLLMNIIALFYLVWFLNLYNFMDGIDGLAAVEAITICLSGVLIYALQGYEALMILPLLLTAVVAGFLCWNLPTARIFMGDAGSGFLGLVLGMFTIQAANNGNNFFWSWLILSGVFIVDATITLFRRGFSGCTVYQAHRSHGYQHATDLFKCHFHVTLSVLAINVLWLLPFAVLVGCRRLDGFTGLLIAYLPLIILAFQFRAGKSD
jgi:Fuc2NAc and GlcNAc transferase